MMPFDAKKLDALMVEAGLDLLLASSRHNVRYLTGGYYFHFHSRFTRLGRSQYLSFVGLPRQRLEDAFYIGRRDEEGQIQGEGLWIGNRPGASRGTVGAANVAAECVSKLGLAGGTIGPGAHLPLGLHVRWPGYPAGALAGAVGAGPRAAHRRWGGRAGLPG
jgi:Xaa-Pro aminopeptidase